MDAGSRRIVLISCTSKKRSRRSKARNLYASPLFEMSISYAQKLQPDYIGILSAKYGLLDLDTEIEPYNLTVVGMSAGQRRGWAMQVLGQLRSRFDLDRDLFVFLAGARYREYLMPYIKYCEIPFEGLPIGKQLQALKRLLHE